MPDMLHIAYDEMMIGHKDTIAADFFTNNSPEEKEQNAINLMRYALLHYTDGWNPERIRDEMCTELLEELNIKKYREYITFPAGYNKETDHYYLASMLFPSLHISHRELTYHVYEQILADPKKHFPRNYFKDKVGMNRASYCLQYIIDNFISHQSTDELYYIFYKHGSQYLTKYRLNNFCRISFDTPIDFLHHVLGDEGNEALYHYYKFYYLFQGTSHKKHLPHMLGTSHRELVTSEEYL